MAYEWLAILTTYHRHLQVHLDDPPSRERKTHMGIQTRSGIFNYMNGKQIMVNVGKYTIHLAFGIGVFWDISTIIEGFSQEMSTQDLTNTLFIWFKGSIWVAIYHFSRVILP